MKTNTKTNTKVAIVVLLRLTALVIVGAEITYRLGDPFVGYAAAILLWSFMPHHTVKG